MPGTHGNGNPLHWSCLENSMDRGAWWPTAHEITKSQTWLSTHTCTIVSKGHSLCYNPLSALCSSWGLDRCTLSCVHHYGIIQNNFASLKIPCASPVNSSLPCPQSMATLDLFYCLYSFVSSRISYGWNHTVAFIDWLLSLRNIHLRFLHVFLGFDRSFLFITEKFFAV